ncbi:hypothetical protein FO519_002702, partial [Halicephalobus sp. NKZ332]
SVEKEPPKRKLRLFGRRRRSRADIGLDIRSYPKAEVYQGPLGDLERKTELESNPLRQEVSIYHSGFSVPFGKPGFERAKHDGFEEVTEAPQDYPNVVFEGESTSMYPFSHETLPLRAFAKLPVMDKMEHPKTPKDLRKKRSRSQATIQSDSDSTSQEEKVAPLQSPRSEGFFNFFRNRLGPRNVGKKRTGFENLVDPGECGKTQKQENIKDCPILEHVHVYHNGFSTQQAIDSGFEEGPGFSADESKKVGTLYLKGKSKFFDKFKISKDSNERTVEETEEVPVTVEKQNNQNYNFDTEPFLGLCSTTVLHRDLDDVPLNSLVEAVPQVSYYDRRSLPSPTSEIASFGEEQKDPEVKVQATVGKKKSKKDPYGFSSEKFEGEYPEVKKEGNLSELPIGEHVMVYHCGRSDIESPEVPKEVFESIEKPEKKKAILNLPKTPEVNLETSESFQKSEEVPEVDLENPETFQVPREIIVSHPEEIPEVSEPVKKSEKKKKAILHLTKAPASPTPEIQEQIPVLEEKQEAPESMKVHLNIYHSGVPSEDQNGTQEKDQRLDTQVPFYRRIFRRKPLKNYPVIGDAFEGDIDEVQKSKELSESDLRDFVDSYHSGFSEPGRKNKKQRPKKRKLNVNLNDYPKDPHPIEENISELSIRKDLPKAPGVFSSFEEVQSPKSKRIRHFWKPRPRSAQSRGKGTDTQFSISGINTRDDVSDTRFSTVVTDKSLFTKGHWPITDIDVDVILKKERKIDCECEVVINGKNWSQAIGGGASFNPNGSSGIVQTSSGEWLARTSLVLDKKDPKKPEEKNPEESEEKNIEAESVEKARKAFENQLEPPCLDLVYLAEDPILEENPISEGFISETDFIFEADPVSDYSMKGNYLRGLSPSTWRRKIKEGGFFSKTNINGDPMAHSTTTVTPTESGMFASIRRRFSEVPHSSSSSGSASDAEIEERHVVISQAIAGPIEPLKKHREIGEVNNTVDEEKHFRMAPQNSVGTSNVNSTPNIDPNSSGPYTPAKEKDGRVIREETIEQVYRISGTGHAPKFDPNDMSLSSTVQKCKQETDRVPRVQMVEANVLEGSAPHTTVHTWHETEAGPETVVTEVDKYGNKVTRTIKTQHTKHTVQKQTYQTYAVDENQPQQKIIKTEETHTPLNNESIARSPVVNTHTRTVAYEKGNEPDRGGEPLGELVSSKTITTGNRTVEILTYKTEKDGVIETRVEHRVTIHSGDDVDHDAELAKALLEATQLSPDLIINRVEVEKTTQH